MGLQVQELPLLEAHIAPHTMCSGPECDREAKTRGLCMAHYMQQYQGRELAPIRRRRPSPPIRLKSCPTCQTAFKWKSNKTYCSAECRPPYPHNPGRKYGITAEEYAKWMATTECASCGGSFVDETYHALSKVLDHCHDTGKIRGVLHMRCNLSIGQAGDDPEVLRKHVAYLERHA